jgi:hypothetical protein
MKTAFQAEPTVNTFAPLVDDLMKVREDELVLLSQVRQVAKVMIWQEAVAAEVARRNIAALVDFKNASATASSRLETLTKWLIVFTAAVVLLTVVLVVHDLTR